MIFGGNPDIQTLFYHRCRSTGQEWFNFKGRGDPLQQFCSVAHRGGTRLGQFLSGTYLDTAMRQLNFKFGQRRGCWALNGGSAMASTYDSEKCVLKFSTKKCGRAAVAAQPALLAPSGTFSMPVSPGVPPGPNKIAFGSFASPESPCTLLLADPLVHPPAVSVIKLVPLVLCLLRQDLDSRITTLCAVVEVRQSFRTHHARLLPNGPALKLCILFVAPSAIYG